MILNLWLPDRQLSSRPAPRIAGEDRKPRTIKMITKSITKLIDEAIIPALVLILAKMAGLYLSIYFLNLPFEIKSKSFLALLPAINFVNFSDYVKAENYSNMAMFLAVSAGTILVLVRAHFLHETHIHPKLQAKLAALNLEGIIAPSYHLYHQAVIWLIFLWLTVGFLIISTILGITYPQISIVAFLIAANFSYFLALDVEKEIEIARQG